MQRLTVPGRAVRMRHLKPRTVARLRGQQGLIVVVDPHGKPPRGAFLSLVKVFIWIFEEWYATLVHERGALLVCDRYYHDLLVDPKRYRYGAPLWTAKFVGELMPRPKLWILLNAPPEILQTRKQEVTPEETARQCAAYLEFICGQRKHAIIDASQPLERVIADVEAAIRAAVMEDKSSNG